MKSPAQIGLFVERLRTLAERCAVTTALEPTGTYGDVLRERLDQAGLPVLRVSGQAAHDYAEAFDGVPSQHDGKDAAVIAELAAFGKGRPWPSRPPDETTCELCYQVDLVGQVGLSAPAPGMTRRRRVSCESAEGAVSLYRRSWRSHASAVPRMWRPVGFDI